MALVNVWKIVRSDKANTPYIFFLFAIIYTFYIDVEQSKRKNRAKKRFQL